MGDIEGTLRVVRFDDESGYAVLFAPVQSEGGALPQLRLPTAESLRAFLLDIGISETAAEDLLTKLANNGSVSHHISVRVDLLRRYDLLPLGVAESILRYLSV